MTEVTGRDSIEKVCCVGGGLIGAAWATNFLARGFDVSVVDMSHDALDSARTRIQSGLKSLGRPSAGQCGFFVFDQLSQALAGCGYVQESIPEDVRLKRDMFERLDALLGPEVPIASSTSAAPIDSLLSETLVAPQRFLVVHPMNPVYLMPLVEIAPGKQTSAEIVARVESTMKRIGKAPVVFARSVEGFVLNRLQETLWREGLNLVLEGIATPAQIDTVISAGLAPRWTAVGPFQSYHLAYGAAGIRELLENGGVHEGWARVPVPRPDAKTIDKIERDVRDVLAQRLGTEPLAERDRRISAVLDAQNSFDHKAV
jgi:carnitine 3-dehydrogenase